MNWLIDPDSEESGLINGFEPVEVLYEFDGPKIFTLADRFGDLLLLSWCDETEDGDRYLMVPASAKILRDLRVGAISVRDALEQTRCWIVDSSFDRESFRIYRYQFQEIPTDCLPKRGTMLLPSLQPLLTLRAIGEAITPGSIPGSVIKACVEGPQKAMKLLSEYVLGKTPRPGKPDEIVRRLFDLPTQRFAFASFEISFGLPENEETLFSETEISETERVVEEVEKLLVPGLEWLTAANQDDNFTVEDDEAADVILRALKELTPATNSKIDNIELSGRLTRARRHPYILSESARRRVNKVLRERHLEPKQEEFTGLVRELDKDRLTFELRRPKDDKLSRRFSFEADLLDDVTRALAEDLPVRIVARSFAARNVAEALAVIEEPSQTQTL